MRTNSLLDIWKSYRCRCGRNKTVGQLDCYDCRNQVLTNVEGHEIDL
jgi:hypothetical protein